MAEEVENLTSLADYSLKEKEEAGRFFPAIHRYFRLLEKKNSSDLSNASVLLRRKRHEYWLEAAMAVYFQNHTPEAVCYRWSLSAESLIKIAWDQCGLDEWPVVAFAMGKLGVRELNLSSDVDLIFVRSDACVGSDELKKRFQNFIRLVTENTEWGFCSRIDLDLRPGGRRSPLIPSQGEFENYYQESGETWERMAFIRMRELLDKESQLGLSIKGFVRKFTYRKFIDYSLLEDLKVLRKRLLSETPIDNTAGRRFHLKLGIGGIRELEFFINALQVLLGGRNAGLQVCSTTQAIQAISNLGFLSKEECQDFKDIYWFFRNIENHIHASEDRQDYWLCLEKEKADQKNSLKSVLKRNLERHPLCCFYSSSESWPNTVRKMARKVHDSLDEFIGKTDFTPTSQIDPSLASKKNISELNNWIDTSSLKLMDKEQVRSLFGNLLLILKDRKLDINMTLQHFRDFLSPLKARIGFVRTLNANPKVRERLCLLFSISPYLASFFIKRPDLIDALILKKMHFAKNDPEALLDELFEKTRLVELISTVEFISKFKLDELSANLTQNADQVALSILKNVSLDCRVDDLHILALGKWGSKELGLRSDLDLIFYTNDEPVENHYRAARRFISHISQSQRGGRIFSIDLRLRPSGKAGPICLSKKSLIDYLQYRSAVWERQAYLRGRSITEPDFSLKSFIFFRKLTEENLMELKTIWKQLISDNFLEKKFSLKKNIGGLIDLELTAQTALLKKDLSTSCSDFNSMIQSLAKIDERWSYEEKRLRENYKFLRCIEQLFAIVTPHADEFLSLQGIEFQRIAALLRYSTEDLSIKIKAVFKKNDEILSLLRFFKD